MFRFWLPCTACEILVPWPGPHSVEVWRLNHWIAREVKTQLCEGQLGLLCHGNQATFWLVQKGTDCLWKICGNTTVTQNIMEDWEFFHGIRSLKAITLDNWFVNCQDLIQKLSQNTLSRSITCLFRVNTISKWSYMLQWCWKGPGMKQGSALLHCCWECKLVQPLRKTVWRFLKNRKLELPYDPAIPLLGIYPDKFTIWKDI